MAAACSGFVYALATADAFVRTGTARWHRVVDFGEGGEEALKRRLSDIMPMSRGAVEEM